LLFHFDNPAEAFLASMIRADSAYAVNRATPGKCHNPRKGFPFCAAVIPSVSPDIKETFLKHVIDIVFISNDAANDRAQQAMVSLIERTQAPLILAANARHQLFIGNVLDSVFKDSFALLRIESVEHDFGSVRYSVACSSAFFCFVRANVVLLCKPSLILLPMRSISQQSRSEYTTLPQLGRKIDLRVQKMTAGPSGPFGHPDPLLMRSELQQLKPADCGDP
jgi:hypothetical protein